MRRPIYEAERDCILSEESLMSPFLCGNVYNGGREEVIRAPTYSLTHPFIQKVFVQVYECRSSVNLTGTIFKSFERQDGDEFEECGGSIQLCRSDSPRLSLK